MTEKYIAERMLIAPGFEEVAAIRDQLGNKKISKFSRKKEPEADIETVIIVLARLTEIMKAPAIKDPVKTQEWAARMIANRKPLY